MITTVNTADALIAALRSAHAGDTILLASGTYNAVGIYNLNFSSAVTIQSADPAHQAVLTNLQVSGSSGLAFNQLHFETSTGTAASVFNSHGISFSDDTFSGASTASGNAMMIRGSDTVTVTGSDFGTFNTGINELSSNNLTIANNTFHGIPGGAVRGSGVTNEVISGNTFADAKASNASHSDVVALWQDNTANHVSLTGNVFGAGSSSSTTTGSTTTAPPTTSPPAHVSSVTVHSTAELLSAAQHAQAGDTILVAAGSYDGVALNNLHFSSDVTIQSADASHQAVINNLNVSGSSHLAFSDLQFATSTGTAATVNSSSSITFSGDTFQGAASGSGNAMMIRSSDTVTVTGSEFGKFDTGVNELTDNNVTISNNSFHDITSGAIRGSGVTNETISGNTFADAKAANASHSDVIALWQDNTANHVTITGNTFGSGVSLPPPTSTAPTTPILGDSTSAATGSTGAVSGGATVTVGSVSELQSALKGAHAGDTILLKAGTYDGVSLSGLNFSSDVTIASADPAHEAVINNLSVSNSSHLAFEGLNVEVTGSGQYAVSAVNDSHVSFDGMTIHGSATGDEGVGLWVRNSSDVSLTNSEVTHLNTGVGHLTSSGLVISGNTFHDIGTDGILGGGSSHVVVSGNTFTDFHPPAGAHPDAIQFFAGSAGEESSDILVSGNVITRGSGEVIQGIFVEHTNHITIVDNAMAGTMYNGIGLSTTSTALIENNFVEGYSDMDTRIIVRGGSSDVTVVGNTTQSVVNYVDGGVQNANFVSSGNTIIGGAAVDDLTALDNWIKQHTVGGAGNDTLSAIGGVTTLTGGAGSDVFSINTLSSSPVQITDFTAGQDKLDLHNLLANYQGSDPVADHWVQLQSSGGALTVLVDLDGPNGSAGYVAVAKLAGVTSLSASDWIFH